MRNLRCTVAVLAVATFSTALWARSTTVEDRLLRTELSDKALAAVTGANPGSNTFPSAGACEANNLLPGPPQQYSQFGCASHAGSPCVACPMDDYAQIGTGAGGYVSSAPILCTSQKLVGTCSTGPAYTCKDPMPVKGVNCTGDKPWTVNQH